MFMSVNTWRITLMVSSQKTHTLYLIWSLCQCTQAITIQVERNVVTAPVQGTAHLSVNFTCVGTPTIRWMLVSVSRQQNITIWRLGGVANVTENYEGRVQIQPNGSLTISDLSLQDSGYYIITVTDTSGNSKDMGLVLTVTEVLYEDVQYFIVFVVVLGSLAAILMLCMWLLNKLYRFIKAWRQRRNMLEQDETELQPL